MRNGPAYYPLLDIYLQTRLPHVVLYINLFPCTEKGREIHHLLPFSSTVHFPSGEHLVRSILYKWSPPRGEVSRQPPHSSFIFHLIFHPLLIFPFFSNQPSEAPCEVVASTSPLLPHFPFITKSTARSRGSVHVARRFPFVSSPTVQSGGSVHIARVFAAVSVFPAAVSVFLAAVSAFLAAVSV